MLLEDLAQDSFDKKLPNVRQKVILERRTHDSRAECLELKLRRKPACKAIQAGEDHLESPTPGEGVDLDCYIQEELAKHEQKSDGERKREEDRRLKGRWLPLPVRCQRELSPPAPEPKKVFRCNFNECGKTYVKSSHLKVINTN